MLFALIAPGVILGGQNLIAGVGSLQAGLKSRQGGLGKQDGSGVIDVTGGVPLGQKYLTGQQLGFVAGQAMVQGRTLHPGGGVIVRVGGGTIVTVVLGGVILGQIRICGQVQFSPSRQGGTAVFALKGHLL